MKPAAPDTVPQLQFLLPDLATMLDARQPLYRLAQTIDWTRKMRARFRRRAAIEPRIGHLKSDYRLGRNLRLK